jgi:hypothetical protein
MPSTAFSPSQSSTAVVDPMLDDTRKHDLDEAEKNEDVQLAKLEVALRQQVVIERLIKQLGSEKFVERETAQQALGKVGLPAMAALRTAAKEKDPERAQRAQQLLEPLERYERIPETVSQVLLTTYMLGKRAPVASPPYLGAEEYLKDIATDSRIAELLQIAAKGSSAERSRMKEGVIAALRKYVDDLPERTGPNEPWRPSAYQAPGVFACAYLLSSFDEHPVEMLDLLAQVLLRNQKALSAYFTVGPRDYVGSQARLLLAMAACHYLDVCAGGPGLRETLNDGQRKVLGQYAVEKDKAAGRGSVAEAEQVAVLRLTAAFALAGGDEKVKKLYKEWTASTQPATQPVAKPPLPILSRRGTDPATILSRRQCTPDEPSPRDDCVAKFGTFALGPRSPSVYCALWFDIDAFGGTILLLFRKASGRVTGI